MHGKIYLPYLKHLTCGLRTGPSGSSLRRLNFCFKKICCRCEKMSAILKQSGHSVKSLHILKLNQNKSYRKRVSALKHEVNSISILKISTIYTRIPNPWSTYTWGTWTWHQHYMGVAFPPTSTYAKAYLLKENCIEVWWTYPHLYLRREITLVLHPLHMNTCLWCSIFFFSTRNALYGPVIMIARLITTAT